MFRKSMTSLTAVALTAAFATAVAAQTPPIQTAPTQDPPGLEAQLRAKGEAYSRAPDSEQDPVEVATTAQLNTQIAAQNDAAELMEQRGAMASAAVEAEVSAEAEAANQRYLADKAANDAAQAEYEAARATWEVLVRACVESGRTNCESAPPPTMPPPPPSEPPVG